MPVSTSIPADFCIPVSLYNKNVLLRCLINDILFCCHCSLMLGRMLVLLWCWKGLPSGGWWWACWRLGDIPWQCSRCPCEQEIQRHARVILFSTEKNLVSFLCCCFAKVLPSHFTESKDVPSVPVPSVPIFRTTSQRRVWGLPHPFLRGTG